MKCDDALRLGCPRVGRECFPGEEMQGDCVPGESVHGQDIKALLGVAEDTPCEFRLQRQPRVTEYRHDACPAVRKVGKTSLRDIQYGGIELIDANQISVPAVCRQCAGAQADRANAQCSSRLLRSQYRAADAGGPAVVSRRLGALSGARRLRAVQDDPMPEPPKVPPIGLADAEYAVEVAR